MYHREFIGVTLLSTLAALMTEPAVAVMLSSSSFNHRYEGDTYGNPGLTGTNTSFTEGAGEGGVWAPTIVDGTYLSFRNSILNTGGFFDNVEWDTTVNNAVGWTIEWRIRIGSDFDDDPTFGAFQVFAKENLSSNSTRRVGIAIGQDFTSIGTLEPITVVNSNDNTDDFHTFRVAQGPNTSVITVWRDGAQIYNGLSRPSNNTGVNLFFGDGSSGVGGPTILLDYFRWDHTGAWDPVPIPEPNGFALIGGLLFLGIVGTGLSWCAKLRKVKSLQ